MIVAGDMLDWLANAGIVGAVVVWVGRWLSSRRSLDGEQQAWLRLIRYEMDGNRHRLVEIKTEFEKLMSAPKPVISFGNPRWELKTGTWEQARARLAELLEPSDRFIELFMYYAAAQTANDLLAAPDELTAPDRQRAQILDIVEHLQRVDDVVLRWLDPYLYAAERRPWWRRYFVSRRLPAPAADPSAPRVVQVRMEDIPPE